MPDIAKEAYKWLRSPAASKDSPASRMTATVGAVRLRDLLTEPVDLLKMDIEGAAVDVLMDCADRLLLIKRLVVEYQFFEGQE